MVVQKKKKKVLLLQQNIMKMTLIFIMPNRLWMKEPMLHPHLLLELEFKFLLGHIINNNNNSILYQNNQTHPLDRIMI